MSFSQMLEILQDEDSNKIVLRNVWKKIKKFCFIIYSKNG